MNPLQKAIYIDVFGDPSLDGKDEKRENLAIINHALVTSCGDTSHALFRQGPLDDGSVPSKTERDWLLEHGYCAKVVVKGEDGFNACTHKGAWLRRCLMSLYRRFNQTPGGAPEPFPAQIYTIKQLAHENIKGTDEDADLALARIYAIANEMIANGN